MMNGREDWDDDGGLGPLLDAYADARLRADAERTGVVRARVMAAARAQSRGTPTSAPAPRRRFALPRIARTPLLAAAALLLLATIAGGALAASAPGGPLYGARLWVEELTLPAGADPRADAEVDRLEQRLAEAGRAAESGDANAVVAALEEYRATADEALAAAGDDPARRARVAEQIGRHVAVLQALAARVPEPAAAAAILAAIERTETHISELLADEPGKPVTPPGKPEATPRPEKTPPGKTDATPEATPRPTPKPKPEATPKPEKTPPGRPDPTPGREKPVTPAP